MMEGRVLKLGTLEYEVASYDGRNTSGYHPLDDKVLVLTDTHVGTTGAGIVLTDDTVERQTMAAEHGTVIAVGPAAFRWNDNGTRAWEGTAPKPGDRVYFQRYSGQLLSGEDGRLYRVMSQHCIAAVGTAEDRE